MKQSRVCPGRRRRRHQDRRRAADRGRRGAGGLRAAGRPTSTATRPRASPRSQRPGGSCARLAGLPPTAAAAGTVISAGLAGVSGAAQRRAFADGFRRASPRGACRATATPRSSACSAPDPARCSAIGTGVVAYRRAPDAGRCAMLERLGLPRGRPRQRRLARLPAGGRVSRPSRRLRRHRRRARSGPVATATVWAASARRSWPGSRDARAADFAALAPAIVERPPRPATPLAAALLAEGAGAPPAARPGTAAQRRGPSVPRAAASPRPTGQRSRRRWAARCCRPIGGPTRSAAPG